MTNFRDLQDDFAKAINELIPEESAYEKRIKEIMAQGFTQEEALQRLSAYRLYEAMRDNGITTGADLVIKSGVNKGSISQYLNGLHIPSSNNAKKLGDTLNVNPLWLMAFDEPKHYSEYAKSGNLEPLHEKIIEKFDKLDQGQKELILKMLDIQ